MDGQGLDSIARALCHERRLVFGGRLGEGVYKETFLVRRPNGNPAALKILKPGMRPDRIHREIAAMHRCNHPNVAACSRSTASRTRARSCCISPSRTSPAARWRSG